MVRPSPTGQPGSGTTHRCHYRDLLRLESILQQQEKEMNEKRMAGLTDEAFHSALAEATHNRAVLQVGSTLMKVISPSRNESLQTSERARVSLASHRRIVEAIQAGDSVEARRAMEEHIRSIDPKLFGLRGKFGGNFGDSRGRKSGVEFPTPDLRPRTVPKLPKFPRVGGTN